MTAARAARSRARAGGWRLPPALAGLLVALALLPALLVAAVEVRAHAVLVETEPPADSVTASAPAEIRLRFNEPVQLLRARLLDAAGNELADPERSRTRGETVHLAPAAPLGPGLHTVSWRVVSEDGHPIAGSFRFAVGETADAPVAARHGHEAHADHHGSVHDHGASEGGWIAARFLLLAAVPAPLGILAWAVVGGGGGEAAARPTRTPFGHPPRLRGGVRRIPVSCRAGRAPLGRG